MKAYQKKPGMPKYKADRHDGIPGTAKGVTKGAKEKARNANRSRKKAIRQQAKKDINNST